MIPLLFSLQHFTFVGFGSGDALKIVKALRRQLYSKFSRRNVSSNMRQFLLITLLITLCVQTFPLKTATSQVVSRYHPSEYNLLGGTTFISGAPTDLQSDDGNYMTFRSYASQKSDQTLYAHNETTTVAGEGYYLQKTESADATGTSLSVSMASIGRTLLGRFVYQLASVTSIPASMWTVYYRAWHSDISEDVSENSPSSAPIGT